MAFTRSQFAEVVGVSSRTLERLAKVNKVQPVKINTRRIQYDYNNLLEFYSLEKQNIKGLPQIYTLEAFALTLSVPKQKLRNLDKIGVFKGYRDACDRLFYTEDSIASFYNFEAQGLAVDTKVVRPDEAAMLLSVCHRTLNIWHKNGEMKAYLDVTRRKFYTESQILDIKQLYGFHRCADTIAS